MKVIQRTWTYEDYRDFMSIEINGEIEFEIGQGEPEDMTLYRDMSDCNNIVDMMRQAYEAGKIGEPFEFETIEGNLDEIK